MSDVFQSNNWKVITDYPAFEMNPDGQVRRGTDGQLLRLVSDRLGRQVVVFHSPVGAKCEYVSDLLTATFGVEDSAVVNEYSVCKAEIPSKPIFGSKSRGKHIRCRTTGEEFKSIADCARKFNFNYDKFYDTFKATGQYQGLEFELF